MKTFKDGFRKVLCVEQDLRFHEQIQKTSNQNCSFEKSVDGMHALQRIEAETFDLIVLAYSLPTLDGLAILEKLFRHGHAAPIIFLVEEGKDEQGLEAIKLGAVDYIVKDKLENYIRLFPAIIHTAYIKHHAGNAKKSGLQKSKEANVHSSPKDAGPKDAGLKDAGPSDSGQRDFLARASHEIRTPMNAVFGLAQLLLQTKLDARQTEMAETLKANADILLKLVTDLIDLSRLESGHLVLEANPLAMGAIFEELKKSFQALADAKHLEFSLKDLTKGQFIGDGVRISQILSNLVSNALKYTEKGSVRVVAEAVNADHFETTLLVTVTDSGIGVDRDNWKTIFTRFTDRQDKSRNRESGSGLGLALSRSLTDLMGGDLSVTSEKHQGSIFSLRVCLPTYASEKGEKDLQKETPAERPIRGTVLIVEDYPANLMVASLMLEHLGYAAEAATNGEEALRRVSLRTSPYTAILMDVQMPDIDGFETTKRIREIEKNKGFSHHIIGVTAHALAGDRERCLEAGMNQYMSKPVHPDILAQKLAKLADAA